MVPVAWRMIWKERIRFLLTVSAVGCIVMCMLFLFGMYEGAKNGATSYVATTPAEIWVCQKNSTNLLRSSSFLPWSVKSDIHTIEGVRTVAGILRVIGTAQIKGKPVTVFVFGFDPESQLGMPSTIVRGISKIGSGEIILDQAFTHKHHLALGDSLEIQGHRFQLSAISNRTNAVVVQFSFTTLQDAQCLLGFCLI